MTQSGLKIFLNVFCWMLIEKFVDGKEVTDLGNLFSRMDSNNKIWRDEVSFVHRSLRFLLF